MKRSKQISLLIVCFLAGGIVSNAQSTFNPDSYALFLQNTRTITSQELINTHPPQTTYYSHRSYPTDLNQVPWYDSLNRVLNFTKAENEMLSSNYFVVSERVWTHSWAEAFIDNYSRDLPLFISSDFILSTLHNSYDAILQTLEWQFLEPNLIELLDAMYTKYPEIHARYVDDNRFNDVLFDVDLYISMARSLIVGAEFLPQMHDRLLYDELMNGIEEKSLLHIALFTKERERKLDLSQFTPRGHYNRTIYTPDGPRTLENYFKAMMWLGRIDFLLTAPPENPWEEDWTDDELRRMQLGALLCNELLYDCGKYDKLVKHEEIIEFLVGPDDNMTPAELNTLKEQLLTSPEELFEEAAFSTFMENLNASDDYGQKIMSNYFYVDPDATDPGQLPVSYKLFGQKFLIDSYVFSEVVYDRIVYQDKKIYRALPDPLDAMAALGNEDALALLETELDSFKYAYKMASLTYLIDAYDETFWEQSLYNTWLSAIRELNPPATSVKLPYFMQTTAWHHEKLNTQLTSWAQLRHDNILYGKQSYTGGTGCSFPYTYVEPYPGLYNRLEVFASNAKDFFEEILPDEKFEAKASITGYYGKYEEIMASLKEISHKELNRDPLNEVEIAFLKTMINEYMSSGPYIDGWYNDLFFDPQKGLAEDYTVADVHTQPTDRAGNEVGNVLHVGNGKINLGTFIAPCPVNPDVNMVFSGPVSTFHSVVEGDFKRLTDQEWEEKFMSNELVERPDWIAAYSVDRDGQYFKEGRSLKGVAYSVTQIDPSAGIKELDYLITFPNPVEEELHLRFILNRAQQVTLKVYDAGGKMINQAYSDYLMPAEHDILVNTAQWPEGLYLLKFQTENDFVTRQIVVN